MSPDRLERSKGFRQHTHTIKAMASAGMQDSIFLYPQRNTPVAQRWSSGPPAAAARHSTGKKITKTPDTQQEHEAGTAATPQPHVGKDKMGADNLTTTHVGGQLVVLP
jgi:hypothetical protein